MAWFKKKPDPISDRARALNDEIAELEAQIKKLDGRLQHDRLAQQRRLAAAARPHQRENLAAAHREAHVLVHYRAAEARVQPLDFHDGLGKGCGVHKSSRLKAMEKNASLRITRNMDCTTLTVVCRPTLSALLFTWKP